MAIRSTLLTLIIVSPITHATSALDGCGEPTDGSPSPDNPTVTPVEATPSPTPDRPTVMTIAGSGAIGYNPASTIATEALLNYPSDVACREDGSIVFADHDNHVVRQISGDGTLTSLAGTGSSGPGIPGFPATKTRLNYPSGVAVAPSGEFYIADTYNHRVVKVDQRGILQLVAGAGEAGHAGDGDPAVDGLLDRPTGVAVSSAGDIYIAETGGSVIRRVDREGVLSTVAGVPYSPGFNGDGLLATDTLLGSPWQVALDLEERVLIVDTLNNRVRRIERDDTVSTIAGSGESVWSGDGGPAVDAGLACLMDVAVSSDRSIFISDCENDIIRRVDARGIIDWYAGSGLEGYNGEGLPVSAAEFYNPAGVAACNGGLIIADSWNQRIRLVADVDESP